MFHLAAYYQSVDLGGVLTAINAVPDQALFTSSADIRVPKELANVIAAAGLTASTTLTSAQLQSPSLRSLVNHDLEPLVGAVTFGSPPEGIYFPMSPIALVPDEALNFYFNTDNAGAAAHYGLVGLADGPQQEVQGEIFTVRVTSACTLAAGAWVNGNLTFSQTLPAGRYQVVGMRSRGTNLVAARLVFPGGRFRPGVGAVNAVSDLDPYWPRYGRMGVFGEFEHLLPPTVECLGVTDSAQTHFLDLIKVG